MAVKKSRVPSLSLPSLNLKVVAAALVAGALVAGAWVVFASPARVAADAATQSATAARDALAATNRNIADIQVGKKSSAAALLTQAQHLDVLLPPEANKIDLVTKIPKLAAARNVRITRMDPAASSTPVSAAPAAAGSAPVAGPRVLAQAFSMSATGAIADLTAWLGDLATYPALVGTSDVVLSLAPPGAAGASLSPVAGVGTVTAGSDTITFTLKAFYVPVAAVSTR